MAHIIKATESNVKLFDRIVQAFEVRVEDLESVLGKPIDEIMAEAKRLGNIIITEAPRIIEEAKAELESMEKMTSDGLHEAASDIKDEIVKIKGKKTAKGA